MILQALTEYYQVLVQEGKIAAPGWGPAKVSFALCLNQDGTLEQVVSVQVQVEPSKGKKPVLVPRVMTTPKFLEERTSGTKPYFLCDNSSYLLGVDNKAPEKRLKERYEKCKQLHQAVLQNVDSPAAHAVLVFFQKWDPAQSRSHPALEEHQEEIFSGVNLVFRYNGGFVHEDLAIRNAWEEYYNRPTADSPRTICLVTGQEGPLARLHPSIKGILNGQAMGNSLVSFNDVADESYGCVNDQGKNAPTGKFAAFAYTTALNHLLSDRDHVFRIGDATVVCWARNAKPAYAALFGGAAFGAAVPSYTENDLRGMEKSLCAGQPVTYEADKLDPGMDFYVLGLSPNAARLSVRFFLHNTFGGFLRNIQAHYDRLEIVRPAYDKFETLPLWKLLSETVNQNSRDKSPAPDLAGEVLRAVLMNTRYPATLLNGVTLRIRAEQRDKDHPDREFKITRGRAAILKAYYIKLSQTANRENPDIPKEVLQVSLNPDANNIPYTLGRLFSVLEVIQESANPGLNATIKDKYFNSAAATPAVIFPVLTNLAQKHLKKLRGSNRGLSIVYDKQLTELFSKLDGTEYPARLNLPQQGSFQLGYYHQTQARYQKKEEQEHV